MNEAGAAHSVYFFSSDDGLIAAVGKYVQEGICKGCTCVVLATRQNHERLAEHLQDLGLEPDALAWQYQYIAVDARATLRSFFENGALDAQRFHGGMGLLIRQAAAGGQPVRVFGGMAGLLAQDGYIDAAIQLEDLWNELSRQQTFTLLCAYPADATRDDPSRHKVICGAHSHVLRARA